MKKLINELKGNINFSEKITMYVRKDSELFERLKPLKRFMGVSNNVQILKKIIEFQAYRNIDGDRELFDQFRYNDDYANFIFNLKEIKNNYERFQVNKAKEFYKIDVLLWNLLLCDVKRFENNYDNGSEEFLFMLADKTIVVFKNLFPESMWY